MIAARETLPADLARLAEVRALSLQRLRPDDELAALLEATRPALLVWDLAVPGANDWKIVRQLRAQYAQLPVLFYNQGVADDQLMATITTSLLLKPVSDANLTDLIDDVWQDDAGELILIVDDDPQTRAAHAKLISEYLPQRTVRAVDGGSAAIDVLSQATPSLVVLDLVMPEIDGFAVLEALRNNPRTCQVPVIVLSGHELSTDDIRRLNAARAVFQAKNILSNDELAETLRRTQHRDNALAPHTSALVKVAIGFIQQHYAETLSLQMIADAAGVSKDYLGRIFGQELGLSPWEFLVRYRVLRAKELLLTSDASIAEIATRVGFDTPTYFSHVFHREAGCSPRAFRARIG